ncbi:hypothetical protein ACP0BU_00435 [Metamycoplasma hominis]|uniref:hypothetical protein n=1 Tax=Metamycoplasma hominis TaxID=2098 RepID=UPI003CFACF6F
MSDNKWRFPASKHGEKKGISSGDTETFKKAPFQAFAREILQNSIDARSSDEEPTRVEFYLFKIKTDDIPGKQELYDAIRRCKEFWSYKKDYVDEYDSMMKLLESENIWCLRVSDFNTTGLIGVETTKQENNKFLALAKGTGVSEKSGVMAGGSKGVGKNAAFLMSSLRTVVYSTRSNQDIDGNPGVFKGSIGVAELVSGYIDDIAIENRDYTQGTGYFSCDDLNGAIDKVYNLDCDFTSRNSEYGTDIYIIGFNNEDNWQKEVVNSLLDSFMATIVRGKLEVNIDGKEINRDTIKEIVYDNSIIKKSNRSNVISQYRLLTNEDEKVLTYDIDTEYGNCELYILPYDKSEEDLVTNMCAMIRSPLMKIKDEKLGPCFRVSAMCIINEGTLGIKLRDIENAQHTNWEVNRIKDVYERKEIQSVIDSIKQQIKDSVIDCLKLGDNEPLDPNGAGDYLPDVDNGGDSSSGANGKQKPIENVSISKPKTNKVVEKNTNQENDNGDDLEPDIGEVDDNIDGDVQHPIGTNDKSNEGRHPGSESSGEQEGENIVFKRAKLSGVKYKVISTNKNEGRLRIIFTAPIDFETCYLNIALLDDANNSVAVDIEELNCNGVNVYSEDKKEYGPFKISRNDKIILNVKTNLNGYFASEVKVICK